MVKKLMYPTKCDKCGKEPETKKQNGWEVISSKCKCGGQMITDFTKPYYTNK